VQADSVLKDSILVLRQENAQLMVEINELKVDLGLREDQVCNVMQYRRFTTRVLKVAQL
jgi:hypothetical protein